MATAKSYEIVLQLVDRVSAQLAKIELASKGAGNNLSKMNTGLGGMFSSVALGGAAAVAAVTSLGKAALDKAYEMSDAIADVQKTTGMSKSEVEGLANDLKKLDTRTSLGDLMGIAKIGGQIGIAKSEMLGFTQAVDKAVVALGDEFTGGAEEVSAKLGKLKMLFKDTKDMNAGEAINKIGSAINALGAAGSATGPEMTEFATRMGALGKLGPTVTQNLGLGAAFQELGLTAEIASGGITNILTTAGKESARFAQVMGMSEERFKALLNSSPNDMLLKLAERFKGASNTEIIKTMDYLKIGSQESQKALALLAEKTDFVRQKQELAAQEFAKGTSLTDEFNIKNQTFAATIDKLKKAFEIFLVELGSRLAPMLTNVATLLTNVAGGLGTLTEPILSTMGLFSGLSDAMDRLLLELRILPSEVDWVGGTLQVLGAITDLVLLPVRALIEIIRLGIVAFTEMVYWVGEMHGWLEDKLTPAFEAMMPVIKGVIDYVSELISNIKGALEYIGLLDSKSAETAAQTEAIAKTTITQQEFDNGLNVAKNAIGDFFNQQADVRSLIDKSNGVPAPEGKSDLSQFSGKGSKVKNGIDEINGGGSKPTTINISIGVMKTADKIEVVTTNLTEGMGDIEAKLEEVLLRVVNSANQVAA